MPPLSPDDEKVAEQYRKMLRMGMPEGAVMQKMAIDGVEPHIEVAVLSNANEDGKDEVEEPTSRPPTTTANDSGTGAYTANNRKNDVDDVEESPAKPLSNASFIEEEIISDDGEEDEDIMEEEVIDDIPTDGRREVYDDVEIEEEIVVDGNVAIEDHTNTQLMSTGDNDREENADYAQDTYDTQQYGRLDRTRDVEDPYHGQRQREYAVQEQAPIPKPKSPVKQLSTPSPVWYWITCLLLLCLVAAAAGVAYWLTTENQNVSRIEPDTGTSAPTPTPVEVTTRFSSIQGSCSGISNLDNPSPVDQCECFGRIEIVANDIRASYRYNVEVFIPIFYESWDEDISSCSAQNIALVWTSSVPDLNENNRTQLYALATTFAGLAGSDWRDRTDWLSYADPCDWGGIACDNNGMVTQLSISDNNAVGVVSVF